MKKDTFPDVKKKKMTVDFFFIFYKISQKREELASEEWYIRNHSGTCT